MSTEYVLVINEIDSVTNNLKLILKTTSVDKYELKRMAEHQIYYSVINWVFISNFITLVPELHQATDRTIIVGCIENEPNIQITIIG